jgi:hypothetical protein
MTRSPIWRRKCMRFSPIEIFQSARVCLDIYGQQNVYLCTIAMELQWVKGFVSVKSDLVLGSTGPLGDTHVVVQISRSLKPDEFPDDWKYSIRA